MDDAKLKQLLQDDLEKEAEQIMEEVGKDQSLADVEAPQEIHDRLFQQIREYENEKSRQVLSAEEKELIRLGKVYRKTRKRNRYLVLAAAVMVVLAIGITSFGGPKKVYETVKYMVRGREQTNISTDDDRVKVLEVVSEQDAYQLIEDTFDCTLARLCYLPDGMEFSEIVVEESTQNARIYYEKGGEKLIVYGVMFNYRTSSVGADTEDEVIERYTMEIQGNKIEVQQYSVADDKNLRWRVEFQYQKVQYFLGIDGLTQDEVEKVVKNLYFFE